MFTVVRIRVLGLSLALLPAGLMASSVNEFQQVNLVSDLPGVALTQDPSLVNPWGMSFSATSPIWVSDNGTGLSTLYTGAGAKLGLTVTIPPAAGGAPPAAPTGTVFNGTSDFGGAHFLFATENGTISS